MADIQAQTLALVLPDAPMPSLDVSLVHAYGRQLPLRVRLLIEFLKKQFVIVAVGALP